MQVCRSSFSTAETLTPFLYPNLYRLQSRVYNVRSTLSLKEKRDLRRRFHSRDRKQSQPSERETSSPSTSPDDAVLNHLDPPPDSYSLTPFADRCTLKLYAGSGGHGCVSFLREKYIPDGPPNGGDGGSGGNIYIQAVRSETSLHRLARQRALKAGRGKNGRGSGRGGQRGDDIVITVPVGTVVRELDRIDPVEDEINEMARAQKRGLTQEEEEEIETINRDKWIIYPGPISKAEDRAQSAPKIKPRKPALAAAEPTRPVTLDLDLPMEQPMLLAAGAVGGLGNTHFITRNVPKPKFASKGSVGLQLSLHFELKMLADVGLVGLPNAGKSTLLRAISNSRTRIGNWAFTTLQPSIGTVILDNDSGRPLPGLRLADPGTGAPRTSFTVADIPGLIEDAHQDRGLGFAFLRHVERAAILAFVVDLSAGDAVAALKALWREVAAYETMRGAELNAQTEHATHAEYSVTDSQHEMGLPRPTPPISAKPWFVVGTKADLAGTQENFAALEAYVQGLKGSNGAPYEALQHPSGRQNAWRRDVRAIPVSAIGAEGVDRIPRLVVELLK